MRANENRRLAYFYKYRVSIADQLKVYKGVGPGFNTIRTILALSILIFHSYIVANGSDRFLWGSPFRPIFLSFVPMFFALSGFLVSGSAFRTRALNKFFLFRALRILPALGTEVTLSALVLGPILTTYTLGSYFTDHRFFEYFGNIIGRIRYDLPGLFGSNPNPAVNMNLWTLQPEFYCYAFIGLTMFLGILYSRKKFAITVLAIVVFGQFLSSVYGFGVNVRFGTPGVMLAFVMGCASYVWAEYIPFDWRVFAIAATTFWFSCSNPNLIVLSVTAITYVTIYVGFLPIPEPAFLKKGDYSYGIYLYGFPIEQMVAELGGLRSAITITSFALPLTVIFAVFSWHFIEKPFVKLKRFFAAGRSAASSVSEREVQAPVEPIVTDAMRSAS